MIANTIADLITVLLPLVAVISLGLVMIVICYIILDVAMRNGDKK